MSSPGRDLTPGALSKMAAAIYTEGSPLFRALQQYRPYICPFEALIPEVPARASLLDIGCGGGLFLGLVHAAGLNPQGTGFDVSEPAIRLAKKMAAGLQDQREGRLNFRRIDGDTAWPDGKFDAVAMIDVIHHVRPSAQEDAIRRACQKVKPGGVFIYKDMVKRPAWRALANRLHDLVLARQWIHYVPISQVEVWTADEGMELERSALINRLWYGHELRIFRRPKRRVR